MTEQLVAGGTPVYAIELDPPLITGLRGLAKQFPNLTVVSGDILELDLAEIAAGRRLRIYGNLPYYITSPILQRLFDVADLLDEIHIVIQHEVALRLAAAPGTSDYGYLSVLAQYFSRPDIAMEIPREAFTPPPEVESALVTLRFPGARATLAVPNKKAFFDFVKLCFAQKRKTLVNNVRSLAPPVAIREALTALQLRLDARAEQLTVSQLAALHQRLNLLK
jgi:16S rRNA (adenine1518-N6/adenine1519-N6)-dimethyltransferase